MIIYNILFIFGFLFFLPSFLWKLIFRGGRKKDFLEKFSIFTVKKKEILKNYGGDIWIHSVSVGETQIALTLINEWQKKNPERRFVLSTTTTTAQELAYKKLPPNTALIFCPIDFIFFVRRALRFIRPKILVIFETEIWPNMIYETARRKVQLALVNARLSDNSVKGYERFKFFFAPLLSKFQIICVQSQIDEQRFLRISQKLPIHICGNMKFDQDIKTIDCSDIQLDRIFGDGKKIIILAASTHPGEEEFIARAFLKLKEKFNESKLIIVPRHAERGIFIASELKKLGISFLRRSENKQIQGVVDCLLADTTGELLKFIQLSDIVIMGKSLAGHKEGHNLIEPALLEKPIITGGVITNFRFILKVLLDEDGVITVFDFEQLYNELEKLAALPELRLKIGKNAKRAVMKHRGAVEKTINLLEKLQN
ncbi:MAG TPA: 3-deoxy-D-manno-octulosonic acid transferase [Victivallales bacterium]|nr:3-deoxy-D-manno-octulosonic acid transferase [Victivallales bacterium]